MDRQLWNSDEDVRSLKSHMRSGFAGRHIYSSCVFSEKQVIKGAFIKVSALKGDIDTKHLGPCWSGLSAGIMRLFSITNTPYNSKVPVNVLQLGQSVYRNFRLIFMT